MRSVFSMTERLTLLLVLVAPVFSAQHFQATPVQAQSRTVVGTVLGNNGQPAKDAVVYLKNTKTLAVKSYIVGDDGKYRFHALQSTIDYEVHAEKLGKRSENKVLSSFDSRKEVTINLQLE